MNEPGFAPTTCRNWGWSCKGQRVLGLQGAEQRPRTSLIGGYLGGKLVAPMLFEGTCNTEVFNQWLENMLLPELVTGTIHKSDSANSVKSCAVFFFKPR